MNAPTDAAAELATRLRAYRPTNEWGEGVRHVICDEAADALEALCRPPTDAAAVREAAAIFHVSRSSDGERHWFSARDAASGVSIPAKDRDDAYAMVSALNRAFESALKRRNFDDGYSCPRACGGSIARESWTGHWLCDRCDFETEYPHDLPTASLRQIDLPGGEEGWVLVPMKPTAQMEQVGAGHVWADGLNHEARCDVAHHLYRAMIAAAPARVERSGEGGGA